MRRLGFAIALALALLLAVPEASAHAAGSPPISKSGFIDLSPANTNNSTYHANITNLGIPPGAGDTLRFSWSANAGGGPAVHFEIHSHLGPSGFKEYYSVPLAIRVDDSWTVPGQDVYMVLWQNPSPMEVNVTYTFQLLAPTDLTVLVVFPVILAVIVLLLWVARRRPRRPEPHPSRPERHEASSPITPNADGDRGVPPDDQSARP